MSDNDRPIDGVDITVKPDDEGGVCVRVERFGTGVFLTLDPDKWERARMEGRRSVLDVVSDRQDAGVERILREALQDEVPIRMNREEVDPETIRLAFFIDAEPGVGPSM